LVFERYLPAAEVVIGLSTLSIAFFHFGFIPWCPRRAPATSLKRPLARGVMADDDKSTSSWYKVPMWNGNPSEWRTFKREMNWWIASLDAESCKKYNVAARWALRQTGVTRARCEEFDPDELKGTEKVEVADAETGTMTVVQPADPFAGLHKLMKALEESMGKTQLDRRGELRSQFYQEIKRNPGERISTFCTRYRTLAAELKREGINLPDTELGWFLKDRLGLDPLRKQLLETALGGREAYVDVESEVLRLFRDLHVSDPLYKRAPERPPLLQRFLTSTSSSSRTSAPSSSASQASTFRSGRFSSGSSFKAQPRNFGQRPAPKQALVTEGGPDEEGEAGDEEELIPADEGDGPSGVLASSLEEVLQAEAEVLASEIQALEEDEDVDPALIDELEAGVEAAAESLVTMREARTRISEVKKDRGFGKVGSGKGRPKAVAGQSKKASTICWDCGEPGHWGGDAVCRKPGAGLFKPNKGKGITPPSKQVRVSEVHTTEHAYEVPASESTNEVLMTGCETLNAALDFSANQKLQRPALASDKMFVGALDSACNRTCSGEVWLKHYLDRLQRAPQEIQDLITSVPESELFRFGNGGCKTSFVRYRLPVMVGPSLVLVWVSIVPVPSLGLLLGRDFLDAIGAVISFSRRMMRADYLDGSLVRLRQLTAGHFALLLAPERWTLPGALRWRKSGLAGVVELQVSSSDWLSRKLDSVSVETQKEMHEHLVTEQGVQAADVVHSGLVNDLELASQLLAHGAQAMTLKETTKCSTPTSSTTRTIVRRNLARDGRQKRQSKPVEEMGSHVPSIGGSRKMAHPRPSLVALAAAIAALCTISISDCADGESMGAASRANGGFWGVVQKPCLKSPSGSCIQRHQLGEADMAAQSGWTSAGIPGRWTFDRDVGCPSSARHGPDLEKGSHRRSPSRGQSSCRTRPNRNSDQATDRTPRRATPSEARPVEVGRLVARGGTGESHHRRHQEAVQTHVEGAGFSSAAFGQEQKQQAASRKGVLKRGRWACQQDTPCGTSSPLSSSTRRAKSWSDSPRGGRADPCTRSALSVDAESSHATPGQRSGKSNADHVRQFGTLHQLERSERDQGVAGCGDGLGRDSAAECRASHGAAARTTGSSTWRGLSFRSGSRVVGLNTDEFNNPYKLHQDLKPAVGQLVSQAWHQHERDRRLVSASKHEVQEIFQADWQKEMGNFINETFVATVKISNSRPLTQEVFTTSQRVTKEAQSRGHCTGPPLSLETGWDFRRRKDRQQALEWVKANKPFLFGHCISLWAVVTFDAAQSFTQSGFEAGRRASPCEVCD
jgi:hypothetical protein